MPREFKIPPNEVPVIRVASAIENKSNKNLCFVVGGGLGDRICAEPTLRFALEHFKGVKISLICETDELFNHLEFAERFDLKSKHPIMGRHLYLYTYPKAGLISQFINTNMIHCVDFCSISALRGQLPISYKTVRLDTVRKYEHCLGDFIDDRHVLLHVGKSWPSRTFPSDWWHDVIQVCFENRKTPVLIGQNCVEIPHLWGCVNLRDKLSLGEYLWLCQNATYLITNDSSPLHIAATGNCKIAFIATCRMGDTLLHYRKGIHGWKMRDFVKKPMWLEYNLIPNHLDVLSLSEVPHGKIEDWLPEPEVIFDWLLNKEEACNPSGQKSDSPSTELGRQSPS